MRTTSGSGGVRGRGAGVIMGSSRPMLPAQYVPEDLISQAQVVLQGRSRNLIIRELQVKLSSVFMNKRQSESRFSKLGSHVHWVKMKPRFDRIVFVSLYSYTSE